METPTIPIPGPGRDSLLTPELSEEICTWIASGKTLVAFCEKHPGYPARETIQRWLRRPEPEYVAFRHNMLLARGDQADAWMDEAADILDETVPITEKGGTDMGAVQDKRVRFEGRLKLAALQAPKKWAPITKNEHSGPEGGPIHTSSVVKEMSDGELSAFIEAERLKRERADGGAGAPGSAGAPAPEGGAGGV